jgi:uncharacterized membrane protein
MASPASVAKHPLHPMLVAFPIGLWVFSLVCDIVRLFGGAPVWSTLALYTIGGGIAGALLAAIPGFIDYLSIDEAEMKRSHNPPSLRARLSRNLWTELLVTLST